MGNRLVLCASALLGSALISLAPTASPATYGPGGVIETLVSFLDAVDRGAGEDISSLLESEARDGLFTMDAEGRFKEEAMGLAFFDSDARGKATRAGSIAQFVAQQLALGGGKESVALHSSITSIRAECPSGEGAYAVVEFDREYSLDGQKTSQAMRATALLSFSGGDPDFRIFHWNAAAIGEAKVVVGEDR